MTDELLAQWRGALCVTEEKNDTSTTHPRFCQYKYRGESAGCQETRRKRLLEEQRSRRESSVDYARRIAEGEEQNGDEGPDEMDDDEGTEAGEAAGQGKERKKKKSHSNPYRNQLMLSEWMVDVPADLEQNWMVVVCPIGKRSLVVASKGVTCAYSRTGQLLNRFPSYLPGGCKKHQSSNTYTLLDCVYHEASHTYYILDVMCWRAHPVYDSDLEFRLFWMKSKMEEDNSRCTVISKVNPFRSSHYLRRRSPLAVWLKPHMVPEVLGVQVSAEFLACSPVLSEVNMDTQIVQS
ncbi:hypothetical protein EMCRGX_G015987 [Ephydatia muelleri]